MGVGGYSHPVGVSLWRYWSKVLWRRIRRPALQLRLLQCLGFPYLSLWSRGSKGSKAVTRLYGGGGKRLWRLLIWPKALRTRRRSSGLSRKPSFRCHRESRHISTSLRAISGGTLLTLLLGITHSSPFSCWVLRRMYISPAS